MTDITLISNDNICDRLLIVQTHIYETLTLLHSNTEKEVLEKSRRILFWPTSTSMYNQRWFHHMSSKWTRSNRRIDCWSKLVSLVKWTMTMKSAENFRFFDLVMSLRTRTRSNCCSRIELNGHIWKSFILFVDVYRFQLILLVNHISIGQLSHRIKSP